MSAILDLRPRRDLNAGPLRSYVSAALLRRGSQWDNLVAANAMPVAMALVLVWLATIGLVVLSDSVSPNIIALIYLLPVVGMAVRCGLVSALVAAIAGGAAADFFFFPPLYSFWISNRLHIIYLAFYVFVAVVMSRPSRAPR